MAADAPVRWTDPEEEQLEERIAQVEAEWMDAEVSLETLRVELDNFALAHHQRLGPMYVRLDELDALIAEATAARTGSAEDIRRAYEARSILEPMPELDAFFGKDGSDVDPDAVPVMPQAPERIRPDKEAQRLYRELARRAHPDLAQDTEEQQRRGVFIARVNEAYGRGDVLALAALAEEWAGAAASSRGPQLGTAERLAWLRQRLEWLAVRMDGLARLRAEMLDSPMGQLLALHPEDPDALLAILAEQLLASVQQRQQELDRVLGGAGAPESATMGGPATEAATQPATQPEGDPMFHAAVPTVEAAAVPAEGFLLDVREQDEWDAGHAGTAVHIPMSQLLARIDELPDGKLYVVCKVGGRSAQVVQYLVAQGRDAVNVDGGMYAWEAAGLSLVADGGQPFVL